MLRAVDQHPQGESGGQDIFGGSFNVQSPGHGGTGLLVSQGHDRHVIPLGGRDTHQRPTFLGQRIEPNSTEVFADSGDRLQVFVEPQRE